MGTRLFSKFGKFTEELATYIPIKLSGILLSTRVLFQLGRIQPLLFPDPYMHNHSEIILLILPVSWNFLKFFVPLFDKFIFPFPNAKKFSSITILADAEHAVQEKHPDQEKQKSFYLYLTPSPSPSQYFFFLLTILINLGII